MLGAHLVIIMNPMYTTQCVCVCVYIYIYIYIYIYVCMYVYVTRSGEMSQKSQRSILRYGLIMWKNTFFLANFKEQTFKNNLPKFRSPDNGVKVFK